MMDKLAMIKDLYNNVYFFIPSLYVDDAGIDFAYLVGAILSDQKVELRPECEFVNVLRQRYGLQHWVWNFIKLEVTVCCKRCLRDVPLLDADFVDGVNGWLGRTCCAHESLPLT